MSLDCKLDFVQFFSKFNFLIINTNCLSNTLAFFGTIHFLTTINVYCVLGPTISIALASTNLVVHPFGSLWSKVSVNGTPCSLHVKNCHKDFKREIISLWSSKRIDGSTWICYASLAVFKRSPRPVNLWLQKQLNLVFIFFVFHCIL